MRGTDAVSVVKKWDEMSAPERDLLVAENVMGLSGLHLLSEFLRPYSDDMTAAWEVVEKLNYAFDICSARDGIVCSFQWRSGEFPRHRYVSAKAKTAPEAICLAALRAVGVEA